ncbi:MAG: DUF5333 family protein [Roseinatronobacter sp.]
MTRGVFKSLALVVGVSLASSAVGATPQAEVNAALRAHAPVYNGLFTAGLIKHIVDTCPDLQGPSRFARTRFFLGLYNQARALGYSRAQIEAFVDDKGEQERLRGVVFNHLRGQGVSPTDASAVCGFARAQMQAGTDLGRQLRER